MDRRKEAEETTVMEMTLNNILSETFLNEILTVEIVEPSYTIDDNEIAVGRMTDLEIRLFSLFSQYMKRSMQLMAEAKFGINKNKDEILNLCTVLDSKANGCRELMWGLIRDRLEEKLEHNCSIGVRQQFSIVKFEVREENEFSKLLSRITKL